MNFKKEKGENSFTGFQLSIFFRGIDHAFFNWVFHIKGGGALIINIYGRKCEANANK